MRGHIAKKGAKYYVVVDVEPDPETGKRRQKWHTVRGSKNPPRVELVRSLRGGSAPARTMQEPSSIR